MAEVYVVLKDKYEQYIVAIFSTREKAHAYVERCEDFIPEDDNYEIQTWMVDHADLVSG
jgi:hypothetical protein